MSAGDLIFVPDRWAHHVANLEPTIAVAANFVDRHGFQSHVGWVAYQYAKHALSAKPDHAWKAYMGSLVQSYQAPKMIQTMGTSFNNVHDFSVTEYWERHNKIMLKGGGSG